MGAADDRLERLENRLARLELFAKSLFTLLVQKGLADPEEFQQTLRELDLLDGVEDGKIDLG